MEIIAERHIVEFELLVRTQNCRRIFRKNISVRDLLGRYGVRYYSQITMHITEQISLNKPCKLRAVLFVGLLILPCEVICQKSSGSFFRAAIAGFARQACEILIQAGCYINEDKACSQKIQLAYCSNALRSIPLWAPSRSSVSLCQMRSPQEGTEIWDILASRPAALFRFFPFVFLCFLVPDVQVQILASHHRWHHRHAFAWIFHTAL